MNETQKGGFPSEIPAYFRTQTNETRSLLLEAAKKNVAVTSLVANHSKAVQVALTELDDFFVDSRSADGLDLLRYICEEIDAVWKIQTMIRADITLIRQLSPRVEDELPDTGKEWSKTLAGAALAVKSSFGILRAAILDVDVRTNPKNGTELSTARESAIGTVDDIRGWWSRIANIIATAQEFGSSDEAV